MPKDQQLVNPQQVKFVREGETLNKDTFAPIMNRFVKEAFQDPRKKDPDETNMQYMRNVKVVQTANVLKAKVFFDKFFGMLTSEQKQKIYDDVPEKTKETLKIYALRTLSNQATFLDAYKNIDRKLTKKEYADEQEKERLEGEKRTMENRFNSLTERGRTLEEAREIVGPYMTEEQLNKALDPKEQLINDSFMRNNFEYMSDKLKDILTPEQMAELNATVNDYVAPWERKPEEMGEKAYTAESEKAKADIDAMQNLSPEQKEAMKKDIDAANDFLRQPSKIEDPNMFYHELSASNSGYDAALMKDEEARGKDQAEKEGLDLGAVKESVNKKTLDIDVVVVEGKEEAYQKLKNEDFKFAPETKEAIKHLYTKMQEYGYLGKGIVLEEGTKKYGLTKLSDAIEAYKDAIKSGDATRIAEASKAMMTEQAHADELIGYVREHFPVDPKSDNFARSGNVDVVRNNTFPPKYRLDEAVAGLNSLFIMSNFVEANGLTIDEFLDHPMKVAKDYFLEKKNQGLNNALKGKTGGAALFEASRDIKMVVALGFGGGRPFEALMYADKDPAIRAHNNALWKYIDTAVVNNGDLSDVQRRAVAYKQGHLDRFLYVTEPRDNASLLGVPIYNVKTLKYDQPEAFDEAAYLQNNGKSIGEMKEMLDKNLKEFLYLSKTQLFMDKMGKLFEQPNYGGNRFVEIAQQAASKVLMAKYAEKDDPAYEQLKGILTNGQEYVNGLIQAEKDKVLDAEQKLAEAQKAGDQKEIDRLTAYIDANKAFKEINVQTTEQQTKYAENLASFEKKVAECDVKRPAGADVKPDEDFNKSIVDMKAKLAELNSKISDRTLEVGAINAIKDDRVQLLNVQAKQLRSDIEKAKEEYIKGLDDAVKEGRIFASYKEARVQQVNDPDYKYDKLPDFFPTGDKKEIGDFVAKRDGESLGFVTTVPEVKAEEKVTEKEAEPVEFSGRWFNPGQEVTKDDLSAIVNEINTRLSTPIVGDNWLENRKEYEANKREEARLNVVFNEGMNAISDETKQKIFDTLDKESKASAVKYAIFAYSKLLKAEGKSEESKKIGQEIFDKSDDLTLEEVKEKAAKFLTDKEKADPSVKPYNKIEFRYISGKNPAAWKTLVKGIPEDKLRSIALKADATQTVMEKMTLDQAKEPRYATEISSLKSTIDNMSYLGGKELTVARKAEIKKLLDSAQDMTSNLNKEYSNELGDLRMHREEGEYGYNVTRATIAQQKLAEQGYNTKVDRGELVLKGVSSEYMTYQKGVSGGKVKVVTPEAREKIQSLKGRDFVIRPETQQAVKDIFAKFDKYGYDQSVFEPEEGTKVYALHKYKSAQEDFSAKIESDDPLVKLQAIEAAQKMQVEYDRIKDLAKTAGEIFGVNEGGFYPGNLDVERTRSLPPEFRNDLGGISALNGLYVMYRTLKERNVTPDELFADPRGFVEKMNQDSIDKQDINKSIKGKSGAEAMFEAVRSNSMIDPNAGYGINRAVETLAKMEKDPALREQNIVSEHAYSLSTGFRQKVAEQRDTTQEVSQRHLDRFLMVNKPCEDASLTGAASMSFDTFELIPPQDFNEVEYLMNNREDPKTYAERVVNEGCKFIAMNALDSAKPKGNLLNYLPMERGFYAMQYAAIKFLACRPEIDKSSEAYRTLSAIAEGGPDHIKELINQKIQKGELDIKTDSKAYELIDETKPTNYRVKQSLKDFKKSAEMKNFGEAARNKDVERNRELKELQNAVNRAQGEVAKAEAQQKLDEAIANRKQELLEDFRKGNITEDYLNKRNEQLNGRKFDDKPPKMFEADQLKSKDEYLREYAKRFDDPDDFNELTKDEKNEIYQRYVDNANRAKEQYITQKYLEKEGALAKFGQKTMAERIAAEDKRLAMMEAAYGEKKKEEPKVEKANDEPRVEEQKVEQEEPEVKQEEKVEEKKVENIDVNLDEEEPEIQEKAEEKVEEKVEAKEEEKVVDDGVEQISIDLDDEPVEMNNDILNFSGQEKNLEKDKGALGVGGV